MEGEASRPEYSVVVPVFESGASVRELVARLEAVFEGTLSSTWEAILVDDGSRTEDTWTVCRELALESDRVTGIRLMRNYGKPGAILCGLEHARGRWIVTIDDDLQQRPEDIPELARYRDHDVVVARFSARRHGALTVIASWLKGRFDRIILGLPCRMSPFKLFKAEVARGMLRVRTPHPFIPALMSSVTNDFVAVTVEHEASRQRRSRYTFARRLRQFSSLLIGNSSLLLRCIGISGVMVGLFGILYAATVIARRLGGAAIQSGWSSLVVINLIFGGLLLISCGIIGEYLIRILEGISEKPAYHVRSITSAADRPAKAGEGPRRLSDSSTRAELPDRLGR